jgi:hypothetical protein
MAISFLPLESEQRQGRGRLGMAGRRRFPASRATAAVGQNEEGITGIRFPYLPWAGMVCGGGSSGGDGLEVVVLGVAALRCAIKRRRRPW